MIQQEYLTVQELSKMHNLCARQIRKTITSIAPSIHKDLLYKDSNNRWFIHHILTSRFKPVKPRKNHYYALSFDLLRTYTDADVNATMSIVCATMEDLEVNYVHQLKKANKHSHLHCYVRGNHKRKLIENLREVFYKISYHKTPVFDLEGWKSYMTKEGETITTIKN